MRTINGQYLDANGPSTADELPEDVSLEDRALGVSVFKLRGSDQTSTGGGVTTIYYLERHNREQVIHACLEANPSLVENRSRASLHRLIRSEGRDWRAAATEVTKAYYDELGADTPDPSWSPDERPCPLCGDTIDGMLPAHIKSDCQGP